MGRISDRALALAFPWWTRPMKWGTLLLAVGLVVVQVPGLPLGASRPLEAVPAPSTCCRRSSPRSSSRRH